MNMAENEEGGTYHMIVHMVVFITL